MERAIKKVLITGIAGSGGSYLAEYLAQHQPKVEIHGVARWHSTTSRNNLKHVADKIKIHECDLSDLGCLFRTLEEVKPDGIFHLASHANVRTSFTTPLAVLQSNIMSTANLLEAVRMTKLDPYLQICSTSEVYGIVQAKDVPISENAPLHPASPYAVSKVTQDLLGATYFLNYGMKVIRTRMFTYLNPRRADLFATAFAYQVARIEAGLQDELVHGNLDSVRTVIDVRDAMEAYWLALQRCRPGEAYNIGGKKTIKVGEFLELLKGQAKCTIPCRCDSALLRPSDVTLQIPDVSKFEKEAQWQPKYTFAESVRYLLEACREAVKKEAETFA